MSANAKTPNDCKILVVDDEPIMVDIITAHLNRAGFWNTVGMSDPIDAMDGVYIESPDLLIVDISMPRMSGNELLEIVRSDSTTEGLPVLVITGSRKESDLNRARDLGAAEILAKPIRPERLLAAVTSAVGPSASQPSC